MVGCCFHCRRASFYACRLDKHLYVIGGRNETGYLSSVESYNLETNEWRYVSSLPQPLAAHAGAVHNGKIYISGKSFLHFLFQTSVPRHFLDLYVCICLIHRGCTQWRICPMAILLWPCNGCLGSKTRYEHKTRHPHFGCNEWSLVCNWRKSFERSFSFFFFFNHNIICISCFLLRGFLVR